MLGVHLGDGSGLAAGGGGGPIPTAAPRVRRAEDASGARDDWSPSSAFVVGGIRRDPAGLSTAHARFATDEKAPTAVCTILSLYSSNDDARRGVGCDPEGRWYGLVVGSMRGELRARSVICTFCLAAALRGVVVVFNGEAAGVFD
mgnify:CR=1